MKWLLIIAICLNFLFHSGEALEMLNKDPIKLKSNGAHHCLGSSVPGIRWQIAFNSFDTVTSRPMSLLDNFMFPTFGITSGASVRMHVEWSLERARRSSSGLMSGGSDKTGLVAGFDSPELDLMVVFCDFTQWAQHLQLATRFGTNGTWINPTGTKLPFARCFHHRSLRRNQVINFVYQTFSSDKQGNSSRESRDGIVWNDTKDDVSDLLVLLVAANPTKFINFDTISLNYTLSIRNPDILSKTPFKLAYSRYSEMSAYLQPIIILCIVFLVMWILFAIVWTAGVYINNQKFSFRGKPYLVYLCTMVLISRIIWYAVSFHFWIQVSHLQQGADNYFVYALAKAASMLILFGFLMLMASGWGIQVLQMPKINIIATSLLIVVFTAAEMVYEINLMFSNTGLYTAGVDLLFACWVFWIVYVEHIIRKGAISMIYCSDYLTKLQREQRSQESNDPSIIQYQSMYKDSKNSATYALINVYAKKLSIQRSIWITCIAFCSVKLILLCMRFFIFISYVPFVYILFHETTDFLVLMRMCVLIRAASKQSFVKL